MTISTAPTTLTQEELETLENALENYNDAPWEVFASKYTIEELISMAEKKSVADALETLRRSDIRAFHAEEAACGNI